MKTIRQSWIGKQLNLLNITRLIANSGIFDREWYRALYPDVKGTGALWHYVTRGGIQGRKPHPLFEGGWYLSQNPDVARSRVNPLAHYLLRGAAEGRDPNPFFDSDWYLQQYADVATANLNPLSHYILHGAAEGRNPSLQFDAQAYAREQLGGDPVGTNPLIHFIQHGWGLAKRKAPGSPGHPRRRQIAPSELAKDDTRAPTVLEATDTPHMTVGPEEFIAAGKSAWDAYGSSRLRQLLASTARLGVTQVPNPEVSILLVLFNRAHLSLMCLESIIKNADVPYELIVVDNNSTDDTSYLLDHLDGARVVSNQTNLGFGTACMQAAHLARSEYLCFLNNDALLMPGSLSAAVRNFHRDPMVGAVGGKLLFSDGRLQESGCILWSDATAWGLGRNHDPDLPEFNFRRLVDYCSGAFLVTRGKLFSESGGFDSIYQPAYYEDTDYCISLWSAGYRVVYEPRAVIAHYESASSEGPDKAKSLIAHNQEGFAAKWKDFLRGQYFRVGDNILSARVSVRAEGKRVLYITDGVADSKVGSGDPRAGNVLNGLVMLGHQVTCLTEERCARLPHLLPSEIEFRDGDLCDRLLIEDWRHFDVVWCTRPAAISHLIQWGFHWCDSRPRIVYEIAAGYANRDLRDESASSLWDAVDPLLADACDIVLVSSQAEADALRRSGLSKVGILSSSISAASPHATTDQERFLQALAGVIG